MSEQNDRLDSSPRWSAVFDLVDWQLARRFDQ